MRWRDLDNKPGISSELPACWYLTVAIWATSRFKKWHAQIMSYIYIVLCHFHKLSEL